MEILRGPHWSNVVHSMGFEVERRADKKVIEMVVSGNMHFKPVDIVLHNKVCWINQAELDLFKENDINIDNIKMIWYIPGSVSPFNENTHMACSAIDGYQICTLG